MSTRTRPFAIARAPLAALLAALVWSANAVADAGTAADRAALFDYLVKATLERTAFSPTKPADIGLDENTTEAEFVYGEMQKHRAEMVAADTDQELYYALLKLNATRWDYHLRVYLAKDGIAPFPPATPEDPLGFEALHAPIKFKPDYSDKGRMLLFVSDFSSDFGRLWKRSPQIGDRLVAVNGEPVDPYLQRLAQFIGRSSHRALWWALAEYVAKRSNQVDPTLYDGQRVTYELESKMGARYTVVLPYAQYETIHWMGHDDHYTGAGSHLATLIQKDPSFIAKTQQVKISLARYRGFEHLFSRPAFDLYISKPKRIVLLQGHSFFNTMVEDLAALMDYARANDLFDYAVIYDLTRGSGGDFEEYTLQKLQSRPFKIMFGNLRISDITPALAQQLRERALRNIAASPARASPVIARTVETPDNGTYLIDWLDNDLARAIREQQAYSSDVQFKNQVLPTSSDGILYPAHEHFTGPMVLFTSPAACSGADQFAAMFIENNLGLSVGMPQGGCSNTWEWYEVLKFPISQKPVLRFGWTVGHSIGPGGAVLEGNSARPRISVPLTRANYLQYYDILMGHALKYIEAQRGAKRREPTRLDRITDRAIR